MHVRKVDFLLTRETSKKIFFQRNLLKALYTISPVILMKYRYLIYKGALPNLKAPKTFDEKLIWLNFYWQHPLKTICGDKYEMRDYVERHGLSQILTPLLGVYESPDEINFEHLPQRFVLKCSHGCGYNIICTDRKNLDIEGSKRKLRKWLSEDFSRFYGEMHYSGMKRKIISEVFFFYLSSVLPIDYKIYCFNGKVHCTMICAGRAINTRAKYYIFYDLEWKNKLPYNKQSMQEHIDFPAPKPYGEMIKVAERLSVPFPFVRMDFYSIRGKAILGEMTFTPDGCIDPNLTEIAQRVMGDLILLPGKYI